MGFYATKNVSVKFFGKKTKIDLVYCVCECVRVNVQICVCGRICVCVEEFVSWKLPQLLCFGISNNCPRINMCVCLMHIVYILKYFTQKF